MDSAQNNNSVVNGPSHPLYNYALNPTGNLAVLETENLDSEKKDAEQKRQDEKRLVLLAQSNDSSAYEQLYHMHVGRVLALCVRLCKDRDMAEDLTQEAFVQAWRKLSSFRGDSAFGSWLYRIATNTALSYLRKQKPFLNSLDIDDVPEPGFRETSDEQIGLESVF